MGFYLFSVKISDPKNSEFNIIWHNNIEIDDVGIAFNKDSDGNSKELIVSYKQNYQNTHNLVIMDMGEEGNMIYKHESFSFWEQKITGIFLNNTKDFVSLSKNGMHIIGLGE